MTRYALGAISVKSGWNGRWPLDPVLRSRCNGSHFFSTPTMPPEGMDRREYLERKFGSRSRSERVYGAIEKAGLEDGIEFHFDKIQRTPCSIDSHRLVLFADRLGLATKMVNRIQLAFFMEGKDIGLRRELLVCRRRIRA